MFLGKISNLIIVPDCYNMSEFFKQNYEQHTKFFFNDFKEYKDFSVLLKINCLNENEMLLNKVQSINKTGKLSTKLYTMIKLQIIKRNSTNIDLF